MRYDAKAFRHDTGVATLSIEADDVAHAERQLAARGYRPLSVSAAGSLFGGLRSFPATLSPRRCFPLPVFCQELAALTGAGLSLIEAIDALHGKSSDPLTKEVVGRIRASLREGRSLSQAMADMPAHFPELLVATIRSSEETGGLAEALDRYIDYRQQLDGLRDKVVAASIYPVLLLAVGGLVVIFLLGYVVPRFSRVFEGMGGDLPYLSRLLIGWGQFASLHMPALAAGFFLVMAMTVHLLLRPETRARIAAAAWRIPAVGERLRVYQLARLTRTLAMLLSGGIPLVAALAMTKDLLRLPALQLALEEAARDVREGLPATEAFARNGLATEVGLKMMAVGERSGELGRMLERLADFYDLENERFVAWSTRLIEPLFMTGIGLVVGVIVLLMYFPIFELAGSLR